MPPAAKPKGIFRKIDVRKITPPEENGKGPTDGAPISEADLRAALLAQIRVSRAELELARCSLNMIGIGLSKKLIATERAMDMAFEHDVLHWLYPAEGDTGATR